MADNRPKIVEVFQRKSNALWPYVIYASEKGKEHQIGAVSLKQQDLKRTFGCIPEKLKIGILMEEGAKNIYAD